jgi:hypothetical protein
MKFVYFIEKILNFFIIYSLIFPSNNENLSTNKTTNKEHFQGWIGQPAISSHESDEIASQLIYPNKKRLMLTTNKELFHSNYGNFKPQPTGIDLFEKTFKINENDNTLDLKTIYRNDFTKLKGNYVCDRVTRNLFEKAHQKSFKHKIPMEFKTQNMIDFIDYDNKYKEFQKIKAYNKLFQEDVYSMRKNLSDTYYRKPLSDIVEENDHIVTEYRSKSQFNLGSNYYYNRNNNNNNNNIQEIPNLKVIKKLPSMVFFNNKKVIPPIPSIPSIPATQRWESSSLNDLNNNNNNKNTTGSSSYREDFKNPGGFELCRMKAYKVLTNQNKIKKIKNPSNEKINVEN